MKHKQIGNLILLTLIFAFFIEISICKLYELGALQRLNSTTITKDDFRAHNIEEDMLAYIKEIKDPSEDLGLYWLESNFGTEPFNLKYQKETFEKLKSKWSSQKSWSSYRNTCEAIWKDIQYFPVAESKNKEDHTVSYVNSWMFNRDYGGTRGHEGTDIMADVAKRGLYPVVSMTDGVIMNLGWLELGGYRIGIATESGAYIYYAHLDSYADIKEGDQVKAGQLLGFMGDTGYSKVEGTTGKFPVHLHLGIYTYPGGEEISINPYWILRYIEDKKILYRYSWRNST